MASDGRAEFDPKEIARAAFPTAFRGYDQEAVRRYLTRLAAAVGRAQQLGLLGSVDQDDNDAHIRAAEAEHEAAELRSRVGELEELLAEQPFDDGLVAADGYEAPLERTATTPLDESELIEQLGQETVRIVEAARSAASDIVQRAEDDAAAARNEAVIEAAECRTAAEEALRAARIEAGEIVVGAEAQMKKSQARIEADAKRSEQESKAAAEEILADAASKAEGDLGAARERAHQIVIDAERLREDILGDLVRRRRVNREHLDRLSEARDRLAQVLSVARNELDEVAGEIQVAVPDGAEFDLTETDTDPKAGDRNEVAELVSQLRSTKAVPVDAARSESGGAAAGVALDLGPEARSGYDGGIGGNGDEPDETMRLAATGVDSEDRALDGALLLDLDDPATHDPATYDGQTYEGEVYDGQTYEGESYEGEVYDGEASGPEHADAEAYDPEGAAGDAEVAIGLDTPLDGRLSGPIDGDRLLDQLGFAVDPVLGTDNGEMGRLATRGDLPRTTPFAGKLPEAFEGRDVALTRSTSGFRRRLKRAVNDDQSDVLDRLRAGRGPIGEHELPHLDDQLEGFVAALRPALNDVVTAGGELLGSEDVPEAAVDNLCIQLAKHIVDNLRLPTIDVIETAADHDREAILDPVRAIYRDFRNTLLPDLIDDALHEAYALGLFHAIDPEVGVLWVTDPRLDPDPICEENSASPALSKGADFPSGHARPLSMPGCRCLAVPMG